MGHMSTSLCGFVWLLLILGSSSAAARDFNITTLLQSYPEFERCKDLLTATNVAEEINRRSSLTILVLSNSILDSFVAGYGAHMPLLEMQYVLQYHVLLEYLDWDRLRQITSKGMLVTTLYQTTGKASKNLGSVNISRKISSGKISIRPLDPYDGTKATITALVKALPYKISVFSVDSLLLPDGFDFSSSAQSNEVAVNVTAQLLNAHNFNFFASMIAASGITSELESDQAGAGITMFAPTDDAFSALPPDTLQSLTAETKAVVLRFHVLHSYYPLGSLESIVNPVQPTLATESIGAGRYTLNITRINGSVTVDTGIVQASITQTVCDRNPLAIFAVSKVLLPQEIFGKQQQQQPQPQPQPPPVQSPVRSPSPQVHVPSPTPRESSPLISMPPHPSNDFASPPPPPPPPPPPSPSSNSSPSSYAPANSPMADPPSESPVHGLQPSRASGTFIPLFNTLFILLFCTICLFYSVLQGI